MVTSIPSQHSRRSSTSAAALSAQLRLQSLLPRWPPTSNSKFTLVFRYLLLFCRANVSTTNPEYRLTTTLQYLKTSSYLAADCLKDEQVLSVETSDREMSRSSFLHRASFTASYYSAGGKYHSKEEFLKQLRLNRAARTKPKKSTGSGSDGALVETMLVDYYENVARGPSATLGEENCQEWGLPKSLEV